MMLILFFIGFWALSDWLKLITEGKSHTYDLGMVGELLLYLIYALIAFWVLFAIQYLCCLMFKRKLLQKK